MNNPIIRLDALSHLVQRLILPLSEDVSALKQQAGTSDVVLKIENGKIFAEFDKKEDA